MRKLFYVFARLMGDFLSFQSPGKYFKRQVRKQIYKTTSKVTRKVVK